MMTVSSMGRAVAEKVNVLTKENFKNLKLGENSELPKVGLMETAFTDVGLVRTHGLLSGGTISWPTQGRYYILASNTGLVVRLNDQMSRR